MQLIDLSTIFLNIPQPDQWMGVLRGSSLALTWSRDPTCPSKHRVILLTFSVVHSWCIISTKIFEAPVAASLATHCRSIARSFLAIEGTEVKLSGKHRKPILKGSNRHDTHMGIQRSMKIASSTSPSVGHFSIISMPPQPCCPATAFFPKAVSSCHKYDRCCYATLVSTK